MLQHRAWRYVAHIARQELLDSVIADIAQHGFADRSLRDIATAVASSHRMLIYHFGSREGLLEAVVLEQVNRSREDDAELFPYDGVGDLDQRWEQGKTPEERSFDRLFFELAAYAASHSDETSTFRKEYVEPWLKMAETAAHEAGIDPDEARSLSRLDVAVLIGLALDRQLTGDDDEIDRTYERYAEMRRPTIEEYRRRREERLKPS